MGTQRWLLVALIALRAACASHHASSPTATPTPVARRGARACRWRRRRAEAGSMAQTSSGRPAAARALARKRRARRFDGWRGLARGLGTELDSAIVFSPVYSAYDGVHPFRVPVTVRGYSGVTVGDRSPDLVDLEQVDESTVMITTRGPGTARIIARAGVVERLHAADDHAVDARSMGARRSALRQGL